MTQVPLADRIAGAPISWGVCEAPDWGHELPPERVLPEMASLGLRATELGPTGYLGAGPAAVRATLQRYGLTLVGGFLPVPMHIDPHLDLTESTDAMRTLAEAGAEVVVLAARSADGSYDAKVRLTDDEWQVLAGTLRRLQGVAAGIGLRATLHPHVGTAVEDAAAVQRLLEVSDIPLCLDTGHLLIGGTDPVEFLREHGDRVAHVHLKDVRTSVAEKVANASTSYIGAVREGLYAPLGDGDLDIAESVRLLEARGYQGWYVLEQDYALLGPPAEGEGPVLDARRSVEFLRSLRPQAPT
jgi:inosose dehydratase